MLEMKQLPGMRAQNMVVGTPPCHRKKNPSANGGLHIHTNNQSNCTAQRITQYFVMSIYFYKYF